ncbi:hypothetical protein P4C99_15955 [Pontiellaceae bacterium B1224]|nr:hypothetical protein [Pontiellaceae bacterium B1224]
MKAELVLSILLLSGLTARAAEVWPYHESFEADVGRWSFTTADYYAGWELRTSPQWYYSGPSEAHDRNWYCSVDSWWWFDEVKEYDMSAAFDLTALSEPTFTFRYHMYGGGMGMLEVQVSTNDGVDWQTQWSRSGQQNVGQDSTWNKGEVDLSQFISTNTLIRFKGSVGAESYFSDMAVDDIWIYDKEVLPARFEWAAIDERQFDGESFPVQITAVNPDGKGTLTTFNGPVELTAWSAGFGNACQNGDFEEGILADWTSYTNEGSSVEHLERSSVGGSGIALAFVPDDQYGGLSQVIDVKGGERYYVSVTYSLENISNYQINEYFYSRLLIDGVLLDSVTTSYIYHNRAYSYTLSGYFDVPESEQEGTRTISLIAKSASAENPNILIYFDDVSVNFAPEQYLDVDPEITGEFVNGVWSGNVTMDYRLPATQLIARFCDVTGYSDEFTTYVSAYDRDFDGMLDDWERLHFGTTEACDAEADADGDGYCNGDEFTIGTHPKEKDSNLAFRTRVSGEMCIMDWLEVDACTYDVEWTSNLQYIPFTAIAEDLPSTQVSFTNDVSSYGFYRIKVHKK